MKRHLNPAGRLVLALSAAGLFTGCFSKPQPPIHFSDEPTLAGEQAAAVAAATPKVAKLSSADALKVELAIYGYLLQRDFWATHEYTAVFIQGDEAEVAMLQQQFPNHVPPVKTPDRALLQPNRTPVDKDTGRPAMIFSVETADPEGDSVQAVGRWYAGGAMAGFYQFDLKKTGDDWTIQSVK